MHVFVSNLSLVALMYIQNQTQGVIHSGREDASSLYVQVELRGRTQNSLYVQLSGEEEEAHSMYSIYWLANRIGS